MTEEEVPSTTATNANETIIQPMAPGGSNTARTAESTSPRTTPRSGRALKKPTRLHKQPNTS